MYTKSFIKSTLLILGMAVSVLILYAQVNNDKPAPPINQGASSVTTAADTLPPVDNTEGLAELNKIMQRYNNGDLYLSGEISFYENPGEAATEKTAFTSITAGSSVSYEADSVQTISAGNMVVMIDKKEKTMAIVERDGESEQQAKATDIISAVNEFKEYIYSITVSKVGNDKKLSIEFKENSPANTSTYEVTYDPETYRIKKVRMEIADAEITTDEEAQKEEDELVLVDAANHEFPTGYYAPDIKVNVYEVVYRTEKKADSSLLDLKKFVTKGSDGYQPAELYKHYELLN